MKIFSLLGTSVLAESCKRPTDFENPSSKDHCIGAGVDCQIDETKWKWHEFQAGVRIRNSNSLCCEKKTKTKSTKS